MDRAQQARVWDIIERVGVCMLTTHFAGGLRARHSKPHPSVIRASFGYLRSEKDREIDSAHDVGLVFVETKDNAYLSITAEAEVVRDRAKAAAILEATDNLWWEGPNDPNVCLLRVDPLTAELWDGPSNKIITAIENRQIADHRRRTESGRESKSNGGNENK